MATEKDRNDSPNAPGSNRASSSVEELLLAALDRGNDNFQTGRYLVTFKGGAGEEGLNFLRNTQGMRVADARDSNDQAATMETIGDADAVVFPEIGVALIGGDAAQERNIHMQSEMATGSPFESIDPEYFVFTEYGSGGYRQAGSFSGANESTAFESLQGLTHPMHKTSAEYMRSFLRAAEMIARDLQQGNGHTQPVNEEIAASPGATWGLKACKVPFSPHSGIGIRLAVLDTGFDLGHPDFAGRPIISQTFVGQPVQDINGHGTHTTGTACGPQAPAGSSPRYGIGYQASILAGKVLTNSGSGVMAGVLAGMNWAISNRCPVILAPLAVAGGPFPAFTTAGQAALNNGCLIIAGSASSGSSVGAPANSPTIMAVAALDQNGNPASFSPVGKIDIAAPGRDILSAYPRPRMYNTWSGIASATAHVAGCAALWAETSTDLRGVNLWQKLQAEASHLPFPATRVGAGLVQAP